MKTPKHASLLVLAAGLFAACGDDDSTGPDETPAMVQGSVEETTPAGAGAAGAPAAAPGTDAEMVAVVQIGANGTLTTVAEASTEGDGSYVVNSVTGGLEDLAVVAYVGDRDAGRVLLYESSAAGATIRAAPINYETTAEARAWSDVRASGDADATSVSEVSLFLHLSGAEAETLLASEAEIGALAQGLVVAGETMTAVYAELGADLDAAARAEILQEAAIAFSESREGGTSLEATHDAFADAALDGFGEAGVTLEETVMATAAAASTLDAALDGAVTSRGLVVSEAVRLNLRARERLAAEDAAGTYGALAGAIEDVHAGTRTTVRGAADAASVRAALNANVAAMQNAVVTAAVQLLAADASLTVQAAVASAVQAALTTARLSTRLEAATDAAAAAAAVGDYRAGVLAGVQDMILAAEGAAGEADAEVLTSLFVAASAGAHVR